MVSVESLGLTSGVYMSLRSANSIGFRSVQVGPGSFVAPGTSGTVPRGSRGFFWDQVDPLWDRYFLFPISFSGFGVQGSRYGDWTCK